MRPSEAEANSHIGLIFYMAEYFCALVFMRPFLRLSQHIEFGAVRLLSLAEIGWLLKVLCLDMRLITRAENMSGPGLKLAH